VFALMNSCLRRHEHLRVVNAWARGTNLTISNLQSGNFDAVSPQSLCSLRVV
jgi:hypothetical protein